ncbi:unnamed protein product, partial [Adineta ricciae]
IQSKCHCKFIGQQHFWTRPFVCRRQFLSNYSIKIDKRCSTPYVANDIENERTDLIDNTIAQQPPLKKPRTDESFGLFAQNVLYNSLLESPIEI